MPVDVVGVSGAVQVSPTGGAEGASAGVWAICGAARLVAGARVAGDGLGGLAIAGDGGGDRGRSHCGAGGVSRRLRDQAAPAVRQVVEQGIGLDCC